MTDVQILLEFFVLDNFEAAVVVIAPDCDDCLVTVEHAIFFEPEVVGAKQSGEGLSSSSLAIVVAQDIPVFRSVHAKDNRSTAAERWKAARRSILLVVKDACVFVVELLQGLGAVSSAGARWSMQSKSYGKCVVGGDLPAHRFRAT
jgi:hypothetical protein